MTLESHPAAKLFPMMSEPDLAVLADDIKANGLRIPIATYEGKVLDGRNRLAACGRAGVSPRFEEWRGSGSPVAWVLSVNLHRRHLSESQRAMIGAAAKPLFEEEARARMLAGKAANPMASLPQGRTARDDAAALVRPRRCMTLWNTIASTNQSANGRGSHPPVRVESAEDGLVKPTLVAAGTAAPPRTLLPSNPVHGAAALGGDQTGCEAPNRARASAPAILREDGVAHSLVRASATEAHSYRRAD